MAEITNNLVEAANAADWERGVRGAAPPGKSPPRGARKIKMGSKMAANGVSRTIFGLFRTCVSCGKLGKSAVCRGPPTVLQKVLQAPCIATQPEIHFSKPPPNWVGCSRE